MEQIDLRKCSKGDILISSQGAILEYVTTTPWEHYKYLDHVVQYITDSDSKSFGKDNYGTRTHDGYVYAKNRIAETDHDIVKIISPKLFSEIKKLNQLDTDEWLYMGCFIQKHVHPKLTGKYTVFKNDKEQTHIGRTNTFAEAKKLCRLNICLDNYLTFD